jgi:hypothetical protein
VPRETTRDRGVGRALGKLGIALEARDIGLEGFGDGLRRAAQSRRHVEHGHRRA